MQIGLSKEEFEVHLQSVKHQHNKDIRDLSSLSSSAETVFSVPSQPHETINNFQRKCDENHNNGLLSNATNDNNNDDGTCQSTIFNENNIISVMTTTSKRDDDVVKTTTINGLLLERIQEESVAFIETNIPFADPVNSGIFFFFFLKILHSQQ